MSSGSREMMERMRAQIERLEFQVNHLITLHLLLREYVGEMQGEINTLHMEVPVTFSQASHVAKNAMDVQMNETERLAIKAGVERLKSVIIWWCNDYSREVVADSIEQY